MILCRYRAYSPTKKYITLINEYHYWILLLMITVYWYKSYKYSNYFIHVYTIWWFCSMSRRMRYISYLYSNILIMKMRYSSVGVATYLHRLNYFNQHNELEFNIIEHAYLTPRFILTDHAQKMSRFLERFEKPARLYWYVTIRRDWKSICI